MRNQVLTNNTSQTLIYRENRKKYSNGWQASPCPLKAVDNLNIAPTTGPMHQIAGAKVLLICDVENITISAIKNGYGINYKRLKNIIEYSAYSADFHAFFSREKGDDSMSIAFRDCNWIPHPRDIQYAKTINGPKAFANSDNLISFGLGRFLCEKEYDCVILASGDGALVCDLSILARQYAPTVSKVFSLSLAGSTSHRLDSKTNLNIAANLEIGLDCLVPLTTNFWGQNQ